METRALVTTPDPVKPSPKRYFSKIPGSNYTFPDGFQIHFHFGRFDFDPDDYPGPFMSTSKEHALNGIPKWKVYYDELEHLVHSNNPLIFQQGTNPASDLPQGFDPRRNALSEAEQANQDAILRNSVRGREVDTELNRGNTTMSDVNASTIDRDLQARVLGPRVTGPGAANMSPVEKARADAEARKVAAETAQTAAAQNRSGMS